MGEQQRYSILSNELIRRLSTLHEKITMGERLEIIEKYIKQLKTSGYTRQQSRQAVMSGLTGFKRKMERKARNGEPMYRSASSTLTTRLKKKLTEKTSWFRDRKRSGDDGRVKNEKHKVKSSVIKSVMFVPYTHGSRLAKKLREVEMTLETMTGYVRHLGVEQMSQVQRVWRGMLQGGWAMQPVIVEMGL